MTEPQRFFYQPMAIQYTGPRGNFAEVEAFVGGGFVDRGGRYVLPGGDRVPEGHWIVEAFGGVRVFAPQDFEAMFVPVKESNEGNDEG